MEKIIECVPNFSEGNDKKIIRQLISEIQSVKNACVLHTDMGLAANRTVITFAGEPEAVVEAAFRVIRKAAEIIDMRSQKGVHPRIGATDVCPLVPVSGITMEETVSWAHQLARRVGEELKLPVYCYGDAALIGERRNLAHIRKGQYEGLPEKIKKPDGHPDYGPAAFVPHFGAVAIGARDFLIAYNIDLQTKSVSVARKIAQNIRENQIFRKDFAPSRNSEETPMAVSNKGLKAVKAIGWYIEEYGNAQVSINLTNFRTTPIHEIYERVKSEANYYHTVVTGSEIIGLVPLQVLTDAGKFYTNDVSLSDLQLINASINHLGLSQKRPFRVKEKILEYAMKDTGLVYGE